MAILRRNGINGTEEKDYKENEGHMPAGHKMPSAPEEYSILDAAAAFPQEGRVACQGIQGANSQIAAEKMFPHGKLLFFKTFAGVFDAVRMGLADFGILPIENNTFGSVRAVYDELKEGGVSIIRSERLLIRHELLVRPGTRLSEVRKIYSHEQAIGQCHEFLQSLKGVEVIPVLNTAVAARMISEKDGHDAAAIASPACKALYGLESLDVRLQDSDNNYTRFIGIAKERAVYPGSNRISLIITVPHKPGSLYRILEILAGAEIDMLKLESAPIPGRDFEFRFYIDIAASVTDASVRGILDEMKKACTDFTYLGNYLEN